MVTALERIRILYLEDNAADVELTLRHMARSAPHFDLEVVSMGQEALDRLAAEPFDAFLLDFQLPDRSGLEVLEELTRLGLDVPAVMVTGSGDTETALKTLKAGAFDYLVKKEGYLTALPATIEGAITRFRSQAHPATRRAIHVLYAEHDDHDVDLTLRHFRAAAPHVVFDVAPSSDGALRRLGAGGIDLLLLDYRLPDLDGIQVLREMREKNLGVPVVIITGRGDEETAVHALKLGALDYVVKRGDYLARLPAILESALTRHRLAEEREALVVLNNLARAVAGPMELEEIFRRVTEAACTVLKMNRCLLSLLGEDGATLEPAAWRGLPEAAARAARFRVGEGLPGEAALYRRTVSAPAPRPEVPFTPSVSAPIQRGEHILGVLSLADDLPLRLNASQLALLGNLASHAAVAIQNARLYQELKRSYEDLKRSQDLLVRQEKMAALGVLAAGVAHELNNPLGAIAGYAQLLQEKAKAPELAEAPAFADFPARLRRIADQALRCGDLVSRLLTYARQREPQRKPVDLWKVVDDTLVLMAARIRMLGTRFRTVPPTDPLTVLADPNMLQQVMINLVTNALDAVEGGGTVRVAGRRQAPGPGPAGMILQISDTGTGMAPEVLARIFDPFFTTKGEKGTGLGLPICLSIIEQHGGTLEIQSPGPGSGSTATIRLPAIA